MERQAQARKPFFAYVALTQPHLPTLPNPAFVGKTGNGDWADMLAEMDDNVGQMLDAVERRGIRDDTIVIFTSDNGPEFVRPWDGWAGPRRGSATRSSMAWTCSRRSPSIVGASVPNDRPIDGMDQSRFFLGKTDKSSREGIIIWCDNRLQAVKWRNYKVHFYQQETMVSPPLKLALPHLFDLYTTRARTRRSCRSIAGCSARC